MSYILEALKKAEAERQLGSAPTIHAAPVAHVAPAAAGSRKALLIGLAAGLLLASVGLFVALRHEDRVTTAPVAAGGAAQVVAPPAQTAPAVPLAAAPDLVAPTEPAPASRARDTHPRVSARPRAPDTPARVVPPAPVQAATPAPRAATPVAGADDNVRPLAELPESIQREVPRVAFGGYIYSPNPADRLLLVDKALRHEGEEVAPGLVLEKLLPKAAIMKYKGYRYRVAY